MLTLTDKEIELKLTKIYQADYRTGFCPTHHFDIFCGVMHVGKLDFRLGQDKQICTYAGHIGYEIFEGYRGNGFSAKALKIVLPYCFVYYPSIFVTCDSDNPASIKTIESNSFKYHGEVTIPKNNRMYHEGHRKKRRYELLP